MSIERCGPVFLLYSSAILETHLYYSCPYDLNDRMCFTSEMVSDALF